MSIKTIAILSASALALAACGKPADTANGTVTNTEVVDATVVNSTVVAPAASPAQTFVNAAAASDAYEIATSKLALEKSASAAVKKYAGQMVSAHEASTAKLKGVVATLAPPLTPDATLTPAQQATLDDLSAKTGAAFDTAYVAAQQAAHQQTLDTLRAYGTTGDVPALKTFATGLTPTVAAHLNMAKALKA